MILQYENFMPEKEYLILRDYVERTDAWQKNSNKLWNLRCVNTFNIDISEKEVLKSIKNMHLQVKKEIEENLSPTGELHAGMIQFQRTFTTEFDNPPHSDSTGNNGEDNGTGHRKFSCLLYLNDNFKGGNLWFPKQNTEIIPEPNKLVLFPATFEYMHGVKQVTSGVRYSILEFWEYGDKNLLCEDVLDRYSGGING